MTRKDMRPSVGISGFAVNGTYKNAIQEAQALCAVECRIDVEDIRLWCQGSAVQCMKMMK